MRKGRFNFFKHFLFFFLISLLFVSSSPAANKKPISYDVYDSWKSIQGTKISPNGEWLVYALTPQEGDGELVLYNIKTQEEKRFARGERPQVTIDNKFVIFTIVPPKEEVDKAKKEKKNQRRCQKMA